MSTEWFDITISNVLGGKLWDSKNEIYDGFKYLIYSIVTKVWAEKKLNVSWSSPILTKFVAFPMCYQPFGSLVGESAIASAWSSKVSTIYTITSHSALILNIAVINRYR